MRARWSAEIREAFRNGRKTKRRRGERGALRVELLARFPEHAQWIQSLTPADIAGLLSDHEIRAGDGVPFTGALARRIGLPADA